MKTITLELTKDDLDLLWKALFRGELWTRGISISRFRDEAKALEAFRMEVIVAALNELNYPKVDRNQIDWVDRPGDPGLEEKN